MSRIQQSETDLRTELNTIALRCVKLETALKQKDKQLKQKDKQLNEKDKQLNESRKSFEGWCERKSLWYEEKLKQQRDQLLTQRDRELMHLEHELKLYQIADTFHSRYAPWVMTLSGIRKQVILESTDTIPIILAKVTRAVDTDPSQVQCVYRGKLLDNYPVGHTAKDIGMDQPFPIQIGFRLCG